MKTPQLVPLDKREDFYALIDGDFPEYVYRQNPSLGRASQGPEFFEMQHVYARLTLATLDLGLGAKAATRWLSEHALAAQFMVEVEPDILPLYALQALLAFQAVVAKPQTKAYATALVKRPVSAKGKGAAAPHVEGLVDALCHSILGDEKKVKSTLAKLGKLGALPSKRKSGPLWLESMREVARACLLGPPRDLTKPLVLLAERTDAYFGVDFDDQNFEPCFGMAALAFIARARDRGFDVSGPDPDPSLPFELLRLPRRPLPKHAWHTWPSPDRTLVERATEAFEVENLR
jgi:hypothetical protein